ncbi:OadG family protein [Subdoligranulum sp. DSM 109015]|uniref:OadG family protein n=1 Tax=Gemmiger gallinarum TaxID=2779354 RepID=A0ABR9R5S0_9FIRM|nr:OadG family transporter subunit [Gemmiger gallinarum]MBE5038443.1 OadG family protein [Gemmiger gallinarum]
MDHVLLLPAGGLTIFDASLVSTSLVLVFGLLILLCLIITLEGKIFDSINAKKRAQAKDALHVGDKPAPAVVSAPAQAAPAPAPAPAVEGGISGEIVAAISAAVYYTEGANVTVRGIRRLPQPGASRRGVWGDAGVLQNTRPFI